jgi:hypothetical protein
MNISKQIGDSREAQLLIEVIRQLEKLNKTLSNVVVPTTTTTTTTTP